MLSGKGQFENRAAKPLVRILSWWMNFLFRPVDIHRKSYGASLLWICLSLQIRLLRQHFFHSCKYCRFCIFVDIDDLRERKDYLADHDSSNFQLQPFSSLSNTQRFCAYFIKPRQHMYHNEFLHNSQNYWWRRF